MSFYDQQEFLTEGHLALLVVTFICGPFGYIFYYLFALLIYLIRKIDKVIEYFAVKADKKRIAKYLYKSWKMIGSNRKNKYLTIGYKREMHSVYSSWTSYSDKYRKSVIFLERNGLLSTLGVENIEVEKDK
jgi:hypothetical protein